MNVDVQDTAPALEVCGRRLDHTAPSPQRLRDARRPKFTEFLGPGTGEPDASTSARADILILVKRFECDVENFEELDLAAVPNELACMVTPSTVRDSCGVWESGSFCAAAKAANANTKASVLIIFKTKYSACNHAFSLARGSCRCCSDRPRCSARGTTEADLARRKLRGLPQFGDIVLKCSFILSTFRERVDTALRLLQDLCGVCEKH